MNTQETMLEALARSMLEKERVSSLTNQELVEELLSDSTKLDILIEEACTRLDPGWVTRDYPEESIVIGKVDGG